MRLGGLVAVLVMSGVLWIYGHGHGAGAAGNPAAYCQDVDRLSTVMATIHQGGSTTREVPQISSIDEALTADARTETNVGAATAAASLTALAADVNSWRTAILTNDAVNQTIALDRILSEMGSIPGC